MSIEIKAKMPTFRILSDKPAIIETLVNELVSEYQVISWVVAVTNNEVIVTAILLHGSELRKMQLLSGGMGQRMQ